VPHRVCNGPGRACDPNLTNPFDAEGVHMGIVLIDHQGFQGRHVGIHRDVVLRKVSVYRPAGAPVHDSMLVQGE